MAGDVLGAVTRISSWSYFIPATALGPNSLVVSILQVGKLKLRKVKLVDQGHRAGKHQCRDSGHRSML